MTDEELYKRLRWCGLEEAADRILSALDMQPTVSPDVAVLVEALENVIGEYDLFRKYEYERGLAPLDDEIHEARAALARVKGETK